jgi:hypothetical protein
VSVKTQREWLNADEIAELCAVSERQARRWMREAPEGLTRKSNASRGRPQTLAHISANDRILGAWKIRYSEDKRAALAPVSSPATEEVPAVAERPDPPTTAPDIAIAALRTQAVEEYLARRMLMTETQAAILTCAEWRAMPRRRYIHKTERIRRHERDASIEVEVGSFTERTLRRWASLYTDGGRQVQTLIPERRGNVGRHRVEIPDSIIDMIQALSVSSARADVVAAIARARAAWPGEWPEASYATILRRLRERDPARSCETLGKRGISTFRMRHSPDIDRDWNLASYNEEWQLDDITEDFYGHGADPKHILRPFAYAIIRCATREWIAGVTTETRMTSQQVRPLLGLALASPRGGIPQRIRFERGAVACDDYLQEILESLGVQVCRTSMDGGRVAPGMHTDQGKGHFQGKGIVESNIRLHHRHNAYAAGQVGPDERHSAPARLDTLKAYARRCAEAGVPSELPSPAQWQGMVHDALEGHNKRPHGALPIIVLEDGSTRHQTPNERGAAMRETVRVMPEKLLSLFFSRGISVPVTKNGVRINKVTYGRFDEELAALQGQMVTVFAQEDLPGAIYVEDLGRCVDAYEAPAPGSEGELIERKRSLERVRRNQFEQLVERVKAGLVDANSTIEAARVTSDPFPERPKIVVDSPKLDIRVNRLMAATKRHQAVRDASSARFDFDAAAPSPALARGRGLLAQSDRLAAQAGHQGAAEPSFEDDLFALFGDGKTNQEKE